MTGASPNVISDLFSNGRGRATVSAAVIVALAYGVSWWNSRDARDLLDDQRNEIRREIDNRFNQNGQRIDAVVSMIVETRSRIQTLENELRQEDRRLWRELGTKIDHQTRREMQQDFDRRIGELERRLLDAERRLRSGGLSGGNGQ